MRIKDQIEREIEERNLFFSLVIERKHCQVREMLIINPKLATYLTDMTSRRGKYFRNVTALQYISFTRDKLMTDMIKSFLSQNEVDEQIKGVQRVDCLFKLYNYDGTGYSDNKKFMDNVIIVIMNHNMLDNNSLQVLPKELVLKIGEFIHTFAYISKFFKSVVMMEHQNVLQMLKEDPKLAVCSTEITCAKTGRYFKSITAFQYMQFHLYGELMVNNIKTFLDRYEIEKQIKELSCINAHYHLNNKENNFNESYGLAPVPDPVIFQRTRDQVSYVTDSKSKIHDIELVEDPSGPCGSCQIF